MVNCNKNNLLNLVKYFYASSQSPNQVNRLVTPSFEEDKGIKNVVFILANFFKLQGKLTWKTKK